MFNCKYQLFYKSKDNTSCILDVEKKITINRYIKELNLKEYVIQREGKKVLDTRTNPFKVILQEVSNNA
jgi:hypothetical protein